MQATLETDLAVKNTNSKLLTGYVWTGSGTLHSQIGASALTRLSTNSVIIKPPASAADDNFLTGYPPTTTKKIGLASYSRFFSSCRRRVKCWLATHSIEVFY